MRHDGADDNGDDDSAEDEKHAKVSDGWKRPVRKEDGAAADPCADDKAHEDMPRLWREVGMVQRIHRDGLVPQDRGHRSSTKDPGQAVPEASEETADSAIFPCSHRGPVVD